MTAIAGTSLLYSASKTLNKTTEISYYEFKALESLINVLVLHDNLHLFIGKETDQNYLKTFEWLVNDIKKNTDFQIKLITSTEYIKSNIFHKFENICKEIYKYPLGITSDQIFIKKTKKGRVEDDLSEIVTKVLAKDFDPVKFSEKIYKIYSKNSTTATFQYLFRGHFFQAVAEIDNITPIFVNHRIIADIMHKSSLENYSIGSLTFSIYKMVNNLFLEHSKSLGLNNEVHPYASILVMDLVRRIKKRKDILKTIYLLSKVF